MAEMKFCKKCQRDRHPSEFWRSDAMRDGLQRWCKSCLGEASKVSRRKNQERNRAKREAAGRSVSQCGPNQTGDGGK